MSGMVLALDFDGVICDSIGETCVTSSRAFARFSGNHPESFDPTQGQLNIFFQKRKYVGPPGEYLILWKRILGEVAFESYAEFLNAARRFATECTKYSVDFFGERENLRSKDPSRWLGLHSYYPPIIDALSKRHIASKSYVVTTKDRASVQLLLHSRGISLRDGQIYVATSAASKAESLSEIRSLNGGATVLFIDDHPVYTKQCMNLEGVKSYLADWGYWSGSTADFPELGPVNHLSLDGFTSSVLPQIL